MRYYVLADDGNKYGPADVATLNTWILQGRVLPQQRLEDEATGQISLARSIAGLNFPGAAPVPNAPLPTEAPEPVEPQPPIDAASEARRADEAPGEPVTTIRGGYRKESDPDPGVFDVEPTVEPEPVTQAASPAPQPVSVPIPATPPELVTTRPNAPVEYPRTAVSSADTGAREMTGAWVLIALGSVMGCCLLLGGNQFIGFIFPLAAAFLANTARKKGHPSARVAMALAISMAVIFAGLLLLGVAFRPWLESFVRSRGKGS